MWLTKLGVAAAMLFTLGAAARVVLLDGGWPIAGMWQAPGYAVLPPLCGLFVAPWFTMITRSALGGVVFTIGVAGFLSLVADVLGAILYGVGTPAAEALPFIFWPRAVIVLSTTAAVLGWRHFMRLEAIEGHGSAIDLIRFRAEGPARTRHPVWLVINKELHLQQMTFVYVLAWITLWTIEYFVPGTLHDFLEGPVVPVTMLYLALLSILIGSLASAEERHLGTLEWQTLLPLAAWKQWAIKVTVSLGLAFALGIGMPVLLAAIDPFGDNLRATTAIWRQSAATILLFTAGGIYVSSLSTSGLRAIVLTFPALIGFVLLTQLAASVGRELATGDLRRLASPGTRTWLAVAVVLTPLAMLVRFGYVNHRSAERNLVRVSRQVAWLAAAVTMAIVVLAAI